MSFLTRVTPVTRTAVTPATRAASVAAIRPASFSTSARCEDRGPVEATRDTLKKADRVVADAAVRGIETGEKASHKLKDTIGVKSKKAGAEAQKAGIDAKESAKQAGDRASKMGGKAKEEMGDRAEWLKQKAKEEAEETTGKA
ncbi:hypothetical protein AJ79_00658 [Helicocarpus griseus UAMH5409]|uniref:LEA domain-containing protein n=1 Tax=Helicocarpus griseus UAMH5409 TaxID=1447875 RepID=A0A2B7YAY8_9EURO|nr:hypothetical protein AJ79_00658 [Helicocarpus griseus UAMH5409]